MPLIKTARREPEPVKVVRRVADEIAVRVWYEACLQHLCTVLARVSEILGVCGL